MGLYQLQIKVNQFLNGVGRKRVYHLKRKEVGINIGSDIETTPAFVGIDGSFLISFMGNRFFPRFFKKILYKRTCSSRNYPFETVMKKISNVRIIHHNLVYGVPFKKESAQFIFTSHFLEHLTDANAKKLLKDCFRVLKKNGIIRITIPDLDEEVGKIKKDILNYKSNRKIEPIQKYLTPIFAPEGEFATHKIIYNFETLKKVLESVKFKGVKKMNRFEGNLPGLNKLDTREGGLIVEARK